MLQQKKQAELLEYRNSRKNSDNDFMATITFNLLENLSKRNNFIHKQIAHYKELDKQFDQDFGISAGFYICSLITCWETFFRDLFIFICDFDPSINQILRKEIDGESLGKLTVGEYFAAKYNFQNLEQMRKALDKIYRRQTASISDYFPTEIFQNVAMTRPSIIFFWISERRLQEKIEDVLATAFNIRHRLTHDANFKVEIIPDQISEIESVFQTLPQFISTSLAVKYGQKQVVFNMKDKSLRFTDNPLAEEMPYAFNTKDFMAEDWQVVSKVDHVKPVENLNKA